MKTRNTLARACVACALAGSALGQVTTRVSVDSGEGQAGKDCYDPVLSPDGRYVGFLSYDDLTGGAASPLFFHSDAFLRDRHAGTTEILSVSSSEVRGDSYSYIYAFTSDVRYVYMTSFATNLVAGDTNGPYPDGLDAFVRDRQLGTTERVSLSSTGTQPDGSCGAGAITEDGRFVAFLSWATNLVPGDTNASADVFLRDRQNGTTVRLSTDVNGVQGNGETYFGSMTPDGRYVAIYGIAGNLVPGDTNGFWDVFVVDRQLGTIERVSVGPGGTQGNGECYGAAITPDGRYVAFDSFASNLVSGDTNGLRDVFLHDRQTGTTERVNLDSSGAQGNGDCTSPALSPDARFIAFHGYASNFVAGDTNADQDVFLRDRATGTTERVSVDSNGQGSSLPSGVRRPAVTPDGRYVGFAARASLVEADTNSCHDIYLRDRAATGFTGFCDPGQDGVIACPCSNPPAGAGRGCDNFGAGPADSGTLTATGIAYLENDTVKLHSTGGNATSLTVFWTGTTLISPPGVIHGAGVRCVSGLKRLYTGVASGGAIRAPGVGDPSVSARSAAVSQPIGAGDTRYYFTIYRDPNAAGPCGNTASTINLTNAGAITWNL